MRAETTSRLEGVKKGKEMPFCGRRYAKEYMRLKLEDYIFRIRRECAWMQKAATCTVYVGIINNRVSKKHFSLFSFFLLLQK